MLWLYSKMTPLYVGHIPRKISWICSLFLARGGAITCICIGGRAGDILAAEYIYYNFWYKIFSNVILFRVFKFRIAATHTKIFNDEIFLIYGILHIATCVCLKCLDSCCFIMCTWSILLLLKTQSDNLKSPACVGVCLATAHLPNLCKIYHCTSGPWMCHWAVAVQLSWGDLLMKIKFFEDFAGIYKTLAIFALN